MVKRLYAHYNCIKLIVANSKSAIQSREGKTKTHKIIIKWIYLNFTIDKKYERIIGYHQGVGNFYFYFKKVSNKYYLNKV